MKKITNKQKTYLMAIFNFLNNTKGKIEIYELKYILEYIDEDFSFYNKELELLHLQTLLNIFIENDYNIIEILENYINDKLIPTKVLNDYLRERGEK